MLWMILFFLTAGTAAAAENQEALQLEQRYDRESGNPRRQTEIAVDLTQSRFEQLRSAYDDVGNSEQQKEALEAYRGALDRLGTAVAAARHVGNSKKAEVFLRRHGRDLENLKTNVSYLERPEIEKLLERAAEMRERILYSIMNPEKD